MPPTMPPVMAAMFERLALGEDVGVADMLGGLKVKPGP